MHKTIYNKNITFFNPIILGTFILTLSGFVTKVIGFYYRIFISRIFPKECLGIIELTTPVIVFVHSLSSVGLQGAITKYVSANMHSNRVKSYAYLFSGILISLAISLTLSVIIYIEATNISIIFIKEPRCAKLLKIIALSFPLASIHSCINSFFFAQRKTTIPAISMIVEQLTRVGCVYWLYLKSISEGRTLSISASCIGLFAGECISALISCIYIFIHIEKDTFIKNSPISLFSLTYLSDLLGFGLPLTLNRIVICIFSIFETIQIPVSLCKSGLTNAQALSTYGMFSAMAMPLIMFPCAITSSVASLLLPTISQNQAANNKFKIKRIILITIASCLTLGTLFMFVFFSFADIIGNFIFHSGEVSGMIRALSFVCPFFYLTGMLNSILHGLGKATATFIFNIFSVTIRLISVYFLIPFIGFKGYIIGILISQIFINCCNIIVLKDNIIYN